MNIPSRQKVVLKVVSFTVVYIWNKFIYFRIYLYLKKTDINIIIKC